MLLKLLIGAAVFAGITFAPAAQASLIFNLTEASGGTPATATITVDQAGDDLQFSIQVTSPAFADILAVWFNVADDGLIPGLNATDVNGKVTDTNDGGLHPSASIGNPMLEFGVQIGNPGSPPGDDFYSYVFRLSHVSLALDLGTFFETGDNMIGLRLQSVGDSANSREGSSKLRGHYPNDPPTKVPEPTVLFLVGAGLVGLTLARRLRIAR